MNNHWGRIGEKLNHFFFWCLEKHPGKLIGFSIGFTTALAIIIFGFWQTILLAGLSYIGYTVGSWWDEGEFPIWLTKLLHTITLKGK
ncbi:MAG: hypothetical protein AWM53_00614 [Candidatus Dichloromethanomonas elyunquensis]|nr:MAG: hypothetical protein AWM53_00614 [Candidatus Dichloromethanomonas elyunquensis]